MPGNTIHKPGNTILKIVLPIVLGGIIELKIK